MPRSKSSGRPSRILTSAELGRLGEARFAVMCAEARLLAQRPTDDQNGWDFLVEFPSAGDEEDDGVPQPRQALVQVKTVWEGARDVDLRLSAAARLGKSPFPSFLCILEVANTGEVVRLHVMHMWTPLLDRVLTKLREMRAAGRSTSVNKVGFRVPVPKAASGLPPRGEDLRTAMDTAIGPDHAAYRAAKDDYLREAGFPTRPVSGQMTFKVSGPHDYQDFMLGLRELPVIAFEATTTRWGVPLPLELSSVPVSVSIRPVPKDVEVIWRRPGSFAQIRLPMKATLGAGPGTDGNEDHWRFVHPNVELRIMGGSYTMKMADPMLVPTTYRSLVHLQSLEDLLRSDDPVDVQVHWKRKPMLDWRHDEPLRLREPGAAGTLAEILRQLGVVLAAAGLPDAQLPTGSWATWRNDLHGLCMLLEEPDTSSMSIAVDLPDGEAMEAGERESLYVTALEFEDCFLACYATCRGQLEREDALASVRFTIRDFEVRDLRLVDKSDDAIHAFNDEARKTTGLDTGLVRWSPSIS